MILKKVPEDFIVKERYALHFDPAGEYSYYLLEKRDMNTVEACARIAEKMHISPKMINFAGTKDRRAVTFQHISIRRGHMTGLALPGMRLSYLGKGHDRVNLGTHDGNDFEITIREIETKPRSIGVFMNLFDDQRFGMRGNNHAIGKCIIKRDFRGAAEMMDEPEANSWLDEHPSDFVGAFRRLPKKILQMYVHSYQSWLWNQAAQRYHQEHPDDFSAWIKVPGFGDALGTAQDSIIADILKKEGVSPRDFIIRQIPEISCEAGRRRLFSEVENLDIGELLPDELGTRKKVLVRFTLQKGSYATLAVKAMF